MPRCAAVVFPMPMFVIPVSTPHAVLSMTAPSHACPGRRGEVPGEGGRAIRSTHPPGYKPCANFGHRSHLRRIATRSCVTTPPDGSGRYGTRRVQGRGLGHGCRWRLPRTAGEPSCRSALHVDVKPEVVVAGRDTASTPVLRRALPQEDRDILARNAVGAEASDDLSVQVSLGFN